MTDYQRDALEVLAFWWDMDAARSLARLARYAGLLDYLGEIVEAMDGDEDLARDLVAMLGDLEGFARHILGEQDATE